MNDTPKETTPPSSMTSAVSGASDAQCAVLLNQWGAGKCAIVEPIFSKPTPEELGCQDVGVTLASQIGVSCDMGEGISEEVLSKVCSVNAMRWNGSTWVKEADMAHRVAVLSYNPRTEATLPVSPPVSTKQPITEESIHRMLLKLALQCHGGPGGGKHGKYFRRFWADALNRVLDEAMRKGVVSEEYDVRDDWEP